MGHRTNLLGARFDAATSTQEHARGQTAIVQGSGDGNVGNFNRVAVYVLALDILSASANCAIDASAQASASAGGYVAMASANVSQYVWVRSSAPIA